MSTSSKVTGGRGLSSQLRGQVQESNQLFICAVYRKLREQTSFSFCLESDWAGGAKVDRAGRGLAQVWRRQIQQLNRVSLEMASAVVAAYPSPQLLVQVCCSEGCG